MGGRVAAPFVGGEGGIGDVLEGVSCRDSGGRNSRDEGGRCWYTITVLGVRKLPCPST